MISTLVGFGSLFSEKELAEGLSAQERRSSPLRSSEMLSLRCPAYLRTPELDFCYGIAKDR